ncbi:hypothetical protein HMSSN139_25170 [Paenibacillus sp. HMSSN-139]|nr:hypothetical protein HMSSN139_25170 [Paenibacillus sp. HMSSN-139]
MDKDSASIVYLRLRKQVGLPAGTPIRLRDVARVLAEPELETKLLELVLVRPEQRDGNLIVIDMLQVISAIQARFPGQRVELLGEPHVLVEMVKPEKKPSLLLFALVWLLLFSERH